MSRDFLHDWDKFAGRFARVYLERRFPRYKKRAAYLSNYNLWGQFHDRKDAKTKDMNFGRWQICSARKGLKFNPFYHRH
jgi:hypothetical protein